MDDPVGTEINGYVITETLGQGTIAVVYKAIQRSTNVPVVIKLLQPEYKLLNPEAAARFDHEIEVVTQLGKHPHIVSLKHRGEYRGLTYFVTDFKSGGNLRELLKKNDGGLDIEFVLRMFIPIADAVDFAHQQGIIHRDLKPENIVLENITDNTIQAYITDFGVATLQEGVRTSRTGIGIGTHLYMAPEVWEGDYTAQSDIYALGIIIYEALEGRLPFYSEKLTGLMRMHIDDSPPFPHKIKIRTNGKVAAAILKALNKDPAKRYRSASGFLEELKKAYETGEQQEREERFQKRVLILAVVEIAAILLAAFIQSGWSSAFRNLGSTQVAMVFTRVTATPTPTFTLTYTPTYTWSPSLTATYTSVPTLSDSPVPTVTDTSQPTPTSRPTATLRPTPPGLGGIFAASSLEVELTAFDFRPANDPEPAAIQFELEFRNSGALPIEVFIDLWGIEGFDSLGTQYGEFVKVWKDYWDRGLCISLMPGGTDFEQNRDFTVSVEPGGSAELVWWLNPVGTQGCSMEAQRARVEFQVDWLEFRMRVEYRISGPSDYLDVEWRVLR